MNASVNLNKIIQKLHSWSPIQRGYAALKIAESGEKAETAIHDLISLLGDNFVFDIITGRTVGDAAKHALIMIGKKSIPQLIEVLTKEKIKNEAIIRSLYVLGSLKARDATPFIMDMCKKNNSKIRIAAIWALGQINATESKELLIHFLNDKDSKIKKAAIEAIGAIKIKEAINQLLLMASDNHKEVRMAVAWALGELQARESVPALIRLMEDTKEEVRWRAILSLGEMADPSLVSAFINTLADPSLQVRSTSLELLRKITQQDFGYDLEAWHHWKKNKYQSPPSNIL